MNQLYCTNCLDWLVDGGGIWPVIFADPPDNIGLKYKGYNDKLPKDEYIHLLHRWLKSFIKHSRCLWFSFNARYWAEVGNIMCQLERQNKDIKSKFCVQTYTFGQHRQTDLGNNYRPLLRVMWKNAPLYPDAIRVPSWRQENGDKRADPRGRVPGDVFDFTRVTGNSKQRRPWHPTQLNEGLVERCIKLTTAEGETVLDPFAGTGTTLRVCKQISRPCTLLEINRSYCKKIAEEHDLIQRRNTKDKWENIYDYRL